MPRFHAAICYSKEKYKIVDFFCCLYTAKINDPIVKFMRQLLLTYVSYELVNLTYRHGVLPLMGSYGNNV